MCHRSYFVLYKNICSLYLPSRILLWRLSKFYSKSKSYIPFYHSLYSSANDCTKSTTTAFTLALTCILHTSTSVLCRCAIIQAKWNRRYSISNVNHSILKHKIIIYYMYNIRTRTSSCCWRLFDDFSATNCPIETNTEIRQCAKNDLHTYMYIVNQSSLYWIL